MLLYLKWKFNLNVSKKIFLKFKPIYAQIGSDATKSDESAGEEVGVEEQSAAHQFSAAVARLNLHYVPEGTSKGHSYIGKGGDQGEAYIIREEEADKPEGEKHERWRFLGLKIKRV